MLNALSYAHKFATPLIGGSNPKDFLEGDNDTSAVVAALAAGRLTSTRRLITAGLTEAGQAPTAESVMGFQSGGGRAWRPETGLALLANRYEKHNLSAFQLAAAMAGMGGSGRVEIDFDNPEWIYLDGWLTPVNGRSVLESDGHNILIDSDLGCCPFLASSNLWTPAKANLGPWASFRTGGLAPRYACATGLPHTVESFPWVSEKPSVSARALDMPDPRIATIHQGWQIIIEHAPAFALWVAGAAEGCLLLDNGPNPIAQSGSSFDHPGLIAISPPDCPVFCGEILVHECSHQQLLVYGMIAPLVHAGSSETSYSPIKRATRSIDRVLTGAHAVGNMILYYAELTRSLSLDRSSVDRFNKLCHWFYEDYSPALDHCQSLTEAGRELWGCLSGAVSCALEVALENVR